METKKEHYDGKRHGESGNVLVYVLIAIVLFAALNFTLTRQTDTGEAGFLSDDEATLYANQIISYSAQAKSAIDQMIFTGISVDELDFTDPSDAAFSTGTQSDRIKRVFHPEGGGLTIGRLSDDMVTSAISDPVSGWYLGRFNNVEWTTSSDHDVILVAYQIKEEICTKINERITGATTVPIMGDSIKEVMIDDSLYTGTNVELTTDPSGSPICANCHEMASLCVRNQDQDAYAFYTVIADQ